jgi:RNA-directed DNA polymerase
MELSYANFRDQPMSFNDLLNVENINSIYTNKISLKGTRGLDGISPEIFETNKADHFEIVIGKCLNGSYKFTPLLQKLSSKGKGKAPRVISISTVRDKIVLSLLKDYLHNVFSDCVNKKLPNCYIKEIGTLIHDNIESDNLCCYKADLQNFYGTIDRSILMGKLRNRIDDENVLRLIKRAISTPTVPYGYKRKDKAKLCDKKGVPQGLSISNILANIYLKEFDADMETLCLNYFRYVDDILVFNFGEDKSCVKPKMKILVDNLRLTINFSKTDCVANTHLESCLELKLSECAEWVNPGFKFEYLGYSFDGTKITVRDSTVERFINSIVTYFTKFKNRPDKSPENQDKDMIVFIDELNEKITGAISDHKQYGWIFYFMEINNLDLLFYVDNVISGLFRMLIEFNFCKPVNLKKLSRAHYEVKKCDTSKYIHNYNAYDTFQQKRQFLDRRGRLKPGKDYTVAEIEYLFLQAKTYYLEKLEHDLGFLY